MMSRGPLPSVLGSGLVFAFSAAVMLGWYVPRFTLTHATEIIDLQGWHSAEQTLTAIAAYTPAARHGYLIFLALDCIFPLAGSWFVITVVSSALAAFGRHDSALRLAYVFPVVAALADLFENVFQALLTLEYPNQAALLAKCAWFFTSAKFIFLLGNYAVFGSAIVALGWRHLSRRLKWSES